MLKKTGITLGFGLLWLFLFSIPVGRSKHLFDVAWFYIVDTQPVHWVINTISGGIDATTSSARNTADDIVGKVDNNLNQAQKAKNNIE